MSYADRLSYADRYATVVLGMLAFTKWENEKGNQMLRRYKRGILGQRKEKLQMKSLNLLMQRQY